MEQSSAPHILKNPIPKILLNYLSIDKLSVIITWTVVASMSIHVMLKNNFSLVHLSLAIGLYVCFIVFWLSLARDASFQRDRQTRLVLLITLIGIVLSIFFTVPLSFNSILMGIVGGTLPYFVRIKPALMIGSALSLPLYFVFTFYWGNDAMFLSAMLFWTFNVFAIVMVSATLNEKRERESSEEANRQLVSTQALLAEASKQSERVRIARNIHDLLGHHLTALTINLQIAQHKSSGEVKENIEQCHALAKLLLSDVREAVSDIRDKSQVDLRSAINSIAEQLPALNIDLTLDEDLLIDDIQIADAIVRCIQESVTNTLKHSRASKLSVTIRQTKAKIKMNIQSDGDMPKELKLGNGLKGMQERIELLKGSIEFAMDSRSLNTYVQIPFESGKLA
ncbi:sensor histidine kinase [Ningiella sp. W23]|uniref:sensor histidine kinase n=1 Tax=Ningiella sp. W23 TaxID=3023715 RepID=UPI0037564E3F